MRKVYYTTPEVNIVRIPPHRLTGRSGRTYYIYYQEDHCGVNFICTRIVIRIYNEANEVHWNRYNDTIVCILLCVLLGAVVMVIIVW